MYALAGRIEGAAVVVPWGSEVYVGHSQARRLVASALLAHADLVLVSAHSMLDVLRARWPIEEKVRAISWGVDVSTFSPLRDESAVIRLRAEWGFDADDVIVVSARGQKPIYRPELVQRAFQVAKHRAPRLRLVIAGYPGAAHTYGDRVHDVGWLTKTELANLYRIADVALSLPVHDQRSTSVLEAAAAGAFVVMSPIPPNVQLAQQGFPGLVVDGVDVAGLSEVLAALRRRSVSERWSSHAWVAERENSVEQMGRIVAACHDLTASRTRRLGYRRRR